MGLGRETSAHVQTFGKTGGIPRHRVTPGVKQGVHHRRHGCGRRNISRRRSATPSNSVQYNFHIEALIGIAGPSGSGKSTLARRLADYLPGRTEVIALDSFYRPLDHLPLAERARVNFDHPDAIDWEAIAASVERLALGEAVRVPVYLFDQHTRAPDSRIVEPADYVVVEGILALYDARVRERMAVRVYVETPDDLCLDRRMARDTSERGRSAASVQQQYDATVRPMALRYVIPSRDWADVIVSGDQPLDESVRAVLSFLR